MNLVILDGTICSTIERIESDRRKRVRFQVRTLNCGDVPVEARGEGAEKLFHDFAPGDVIHVRGRIASGGCVAADHIRRVGATPEPATPSKRPPHSTSRPTLHFDADARGNSPLQLKWCFPVAQAAG